ncbi:MAG: hypothetical protein HYY34_06445, partial [Chloroflexi bacterium]|nr:hypothetical protein [Chloroflexota bacterium]
QRLNATMGSGRVADASGGADTVSASLEELASIDFISEDLSATLRSEAKDSQNFAMVDRWLANHRNRIEQRLARYYGSRATEDGIRGLDELIRRYPARAHFYMERAHLKQWFGQLSAAEEDYLLAASLDPDKPEPHLWLGRLYEQQGLSSRALYAYRLYLSISGDDAERAEVQSKARRLEGSLIAAGPRHDAGAVAETASRLGYLIDALEDIRAETNLDDVLLVRLIRVYSERLNLLVAPSVPESPEDVVETASSVRTPAPSPAAATPSIVEASPPDLRTVLAAAGAASHTEHGLIAEFEPGVTEAEPSVRRRPPRAPRKPVNWGAVFAALLSERTLTTILAFGVLLVAVSSVALLVDQWRSSPSYTDVWPRIQIILVCQFLMFIAAGHIVKERLKLRLSGLAILTLGALWVPFNIGAWMFREFVAPGEVVLPGLGLPVDLPLIAWLYVAAFCIPTWLLLTLRYKGHLLTHGTVAAAAATLALALSVVGLSWEWSVASIAILAVPLIVVWRVSRDSSYGAVTAPLFWTAQALLLGVIGILVGFWAAGVIESYPLALSGAVGTGLYILAYRYTSQRVYEYLLTGLPAISVLYSLGESSLVPIRHFDALLLGMGAAYLMAGVLSRERYNGNVLGRWPILQPMRAIGYALVAAAALWLEVDQVSRTAVLYGVTAVAVASAASYRQPHWTWLAASLFVAPFLMTIDLIGWLSADYVGVAFGLLGCGYLVAAVILRRSRAHAAPLLVGAFALSVASFVSAFSYDPFDDPRIPALTLPLVLATLGGFWYLLRADRDEALWWVLGSVYAALGYRHDQSTRDEPRRWAAPFVVAMIGAIVPLWTGMLSLWAGVPDVWIGSDLVLLGGAYGIAGTWLAGRNGRSDAMVLRSLAIALAAIAPLYHVAAAGVDWGLAGVLYADVALAVASARSFRQPQWTWLAASLLVAPILLTIDLIGWLSAGYLGVGLGLLGCGYLTAAVILRRSPTHATPLLVGAFALAVASLVSAFSYDPINVPRIPALTLPLVLATLGAFWYLLRAGRDEALERVLRSVHAALWYEHDRVNQDDPRRWAAVLFITMIGVIVPLWTGMLHLWAGVPDVWIGSDLILLAGAYAIAGTWLARRNSRPDALVLWSLGIVLAAIAPVYHVAAAGVDWGLAGILYANVSLLALPVLPWRRNRAIGAAAGLLPAPLGVTLWLVGVPVAYWAVCWALLGAGYFAGAVASGRHPVSASLLGVASVLGIASVIWAAAEPWGVAARWTLPITVLMFGVAAVLAHGGKPGDIEGAFRRFASLVGFQLQPQLVRYGLPIAFGAVATVLVPAWVAMLLVWRGVSGPVHAYNLLGIAFALAILALTLRRFEAPYGRASLFGSGAAAFAAVVTTLAFPEINQAVVIGVLYGTALLSGLFRLHMHRPEPVYIAAALLPVPFVLTLDLARVDPLLWGTPLMALATGYLVLSAALRARLPVGSAAPLAHVGWILSAIAVAWTAFWGAARVAGIEPDTTLTLGGERLYASLALFLGAAAYAVAAYRLRSAGLGHVSTWVLAAALGLVLVATPLSMRHIAIVVAGLAFASVLAGARLARRLNQGRVELSFSPEWGWQRAALVFAEPIAWAAYGAAAISVALATFDLLGRGGQVWAANATYLTVVALLVTSAWLRRSPAFLVLGTGLFVGPFSLGAYDVWGSSAGLPALPSAALAFGWTGLAIGYLTLGLVIERRSSRYATPLVAIGYLLFAGAVPASLGSAGRQSVVFGAIVLVSIASAYLIHRGGSGTLVSLVSTVFGTSIDDARRFSAAALVWLAGLLCPLWVLEVLALFTAEAPAQGLALALLAPMYLLAAVWFARQKLDAYSRPLRVAGYGMALVAPALSWSSYGPGVATLAVASVTFLISGYVSRRTAWSIAAHAASIVLLSLTVARAISPLTPTREMYGLGILLLAITYTAMSSLAGTRGRARQPAGPLAGFALSAAGVGLSIPGASEGWPISIAAFAVAAVFYGAAAFRLGVPLLLYPAAGLGTASYLLAIALISVEPSSFGMALLPGAVASLIVGWITHRWVPAHMARARMAPAQGPLPEAVYRVIAVRAPLGSSGPFLIIGFGLGLASALFSAPYEIQRLAALVALTGIFAVSLAVFRGWVWLYPLLLSAHLSWAALITLPQIGLAGPAIGLLFIPPAVAVVSALGAISRGQKMPGVRNLLRQPYFALMLFAGLDLATSVALAAMSDWSGILMSATYATLAAVAAQRTRIRFLPYVATGFLTAAVIFTSRLLGLTWSEAAVVWATQGLLMWWASHAVAFLARGSPNGDARAADQALWQVPLRNAGLRLSWFALAFVVAMLCLGLVVPDRLGSSMRDASAVMAILGLLYLGMAFLARRVWFGYVAVALLLGSWVVQAIDLEIPNAQAYAIPAGLYLLALSYFERRRVAAATGYA